MITSPNAVCGHTRLRSAPTVAGTEIAVVLSSLRDVSTVKDSFGD